MQVSSAGPLSGDARLTRIARRRHFHSRHLHILRQFVTFGVLLKFPKERFPSMNRSLAMLVALGLVCLANQDLLNRVKGDSPIFADTKIGTVPDFSPFDAIAIPSPMFDNTLWSRGWMAPRNERNARRRRFR